MYVGYDENADMTLTMKNCIIANGYGAVYFGPRVTLSCQYNLFFRPERTSRLLPTTMISPAAIFSTGFWVRATKWRILCLSGLHGVRRAIII